MPRLLALSANSSWNLLNFRRGLIGGLIERGYSVVALVPPGEGADQLQRMGVRVVELPMSPRGLSPASDLRLVGSYLKWLREIRPVAFLGFTAKPNIYGSIAARLAGVPVIANITGLGTGFLSGRALELVLSRLYRLALSSAHTVFFHNPDDRDLFVSRGLCRMEASQVIPGSGVDLQRFAAVPDAHNEDPVFLFVGRFLKDKGIAEYVEAAGQLKKNRAALRFQALGTADPHPKSIPVETVRQWKDEGVVEFLGTADDVRPFIAASDCVVLPSYREGLPRVLLEASAIGRAVIGTDVPGCRQVVEDGVTGFLCEPRSAQSLADAMWKFETLRPDQRRFMGDEARRKAEQEFGEDKVIGAYLTALGKLFSDSSAATAKWQ